METILALSAPVYGFVVGTLVFSRVGFWVFAIVAAIRTQDELPGLAHSAKWAAVASAALLHSGPWLLAAVAYWAYYILSRPHAPPWDWFFGAAVVALPIWAIFSIYLANRDKRAKAQTKGRSENVVSLSQETPLK